MDILNVHNWPDEYDIQYGIKFLKRLATKFKIDKLSTFQSFCEFKDLKNVSLTYSLKKLIVVFNTI